MDIVIPRYILSFLIVLLTIYGYFNSPQRCSEKPKCSFLLRFSCNKSLFILTLLIVILETLFIVYLSYNTPLSDNLPSYWWLVIPLLGFIFAHSIYVSTEKVKDDGKFVPLPYGMLEKKNRNRIFTIILFLYIISILLEMYITTNNKLDISILSSFLNNVFYGRGLDNILYYIFAWVRIIGVIIILYYKNLQTTFGSCKYLLPYNWNK